MGVRALNWDAVQLSGQHVASAVETSCNSRGGYLGVMGWLQRQKTLQHNCTTPFIRISNNIITTRLTPLPHYKREVEVAALFNCALSSTYTNMQLLQRVSGNCQPNINLNQYAIIINYVIRISISK